MHYTSISTFNNDLIWRPSGYSYAEATRSETEEVGWSGFSAAKQCQQSLSAERGHGYEGRGEECETYSAARAALTGRATLALIARTVVSHDGD